MSSVPTDRKKPLKGLVKGFISASTILLQGPPGKSGLPLEKTLYLNGIWTPPMSLNGETKEEPLGFLAREHVRLAIIGHRVEFFIEQMVGTKEYGSLYDNGKDLAIGLLEAGLAKLVLKVENNTLRPFNLEDYKKAEEQAKAKKLGLWAEASNLPALAKRPLDRVDVGAVFPSLKNKKVKGIIEEFNGSAFTVYAHDLKGFFKFHLQALAISSFNFKHLQETKIFVEEKLLQREAEFLIENKDNTANAFLGEVLYKGIDLPNLLLAQGFAKLGQEAVTELDNKRFQELKQCMEEAQNQKLRVWKEHKPVAKSSKKNETSFLGKVIEVHSGDSITVMNPVNNELRRLFLANIRAPNVGNPKRGEPEKPWGFDAKEFLRTTLVGKKVKVEIEYSKTIQPKDKDLGEESDRKPSPPLVLEFATIWLNEKNIAEVLLEAGLANVQMPRVDEEFSKYMKNLKEAETVGREAKKGVFSGKEKVLVKFNDLSLQKNPGKIKTFFSFIEKEKKMSGVVELALSGSRYKVRLNAHNSYIIMALQGIKCLPNDSNIKNYAEISNKALLYAKENILQRDVELEIDTIDNRGTILGSIIHAKKNFALNLLENGLAYVNPIGKGSAHHAAYEAAEKEAKQNQVGIWKTGLIFNEATGSFGVKPQKLDEKGTFVCTEISTAESFYLQDTKSNQLRFIQRELEKFNEDSEEKLKPPVKAGTPCVAVFLDDGKWYRAKISKHVKGNKYLVFYMDYGNYDEVILEDVRKMPSKLLSVDPLAQLCGLAYVKTPNLEHEMGETVASWLKDKIWNKEVNVEFFYSISGKKHAIIRNVEEKDNRKSINLEAIANGYGKISNEVALPKELDFWSKEEENASTNELGVWKYDEEDEAEDLYND